MSSVTDRYKELLLIVNQKFNKKHSYFTFRNYCIRKFKSKVKISHKSHIKKEANAVKALKKTSKIIIKK